jgi:SAM-dependent methyltransferase
MTPSLTHAPSQARTRARDWAEIQERMLVPLYEAVYDRLEIGPATRLLGLGCGCGLALLMAARRGAAVTGCEPDALRLALARERLLPEPRRGGPAHLRARACPLHDRPEDVDSAPFTVITALDPETPTAGLARAARLAEHGSAVVLAGWGPSERCATAQVLRTATRLAEPRHPAHALLSRRDDLEEQAMACGLRPDGSGRVACPFGYPDMDSAVRGLVSTGLFDDAVAATDERQMEKELTEALHLHQRPDGTIRMENVFRYVIARVP